MTGICWVDEEESWVFMGTGAVRGDSNWEAGRDGNSGLNCEGRGLQPVRMITGVSAARPFVTGMVAADSGARSVKLVL